MYRELPGKWTYQAGSGNGTITLPVGATLLQVLAHSSPNGTVSLFGGPTVATPNNDVFDIRLLHANAVATSANGGAIVYTNMLTIFVEYVLVTPGNGP